MAVKNPATYPLKNGVRVSKYTEGCGHNVSARDKASRDLLAQDIVATIATAGLTADQQQVSRLLLVGANKKGFCPDSLKVPVSTNKHGVATVYIAAPDMRPSYPVWDCDTKRCRIDRYDDNGGFMGGFTNYYDFVIG
jgi:hypothetical protein